MTLKDKYKDRKPIGMYCMCNFGGLVFYDTDEDCDFVTAFDFGEPKDFRRSNVKYTDSGRAYVNRSGRVYMDEVLRV